MMVSRMSHGINDYLTVIADKLKIDHNDLTRQSIIKASARTIGTQVMGVRIGKTDILETKPFIGHYKKWKDIKGISRLHEAQ